MKKKDKSINAHDDMDTTSNHVKQIRKKRSCLMCGEMFDSKGPFNRRCLKCEQLVYQRKKGMFDPLPQHNIALKKEDILKFI